MIEANSSTTSCSVSSEQLRTPECVDGLTGPVSWRVAVCVEDAPPDAMEPDAFPLFKAAPELHACNNDAAKMNTKSQLHLRILRPQSFWCGQFLYSPSVHRSLSRF